MLHTLATPLAVRSQILAADCIPSNTTLTGPLGGIIDKLEGALGGLMFTVVPVVAIALALAAVLLIVSDRASGLMKAIAVVLLVPLVLIIALVIYAAALKGFNSAC